jgi:hypothetical protein
LGTPPRTQKRGSRETVGAADLADFMSEQQLRWPLAVEMIDSPVKDWRQVRDLDLSIDPVMEEFVLSFTRRNAARIRRST